jgi:hypothetical protein
MTYPLNMYPPVHDIRQSVQNDLEVDTNLLCFSLCIFFRLHIEIPAIPISGRSCISIEILEMRVLKIFEE